MKILIIRLSAMGDVAMSVPVIKAMSEKYSDAELFMLTNKVFNPFFSEVNNITFINPDLKGKHKGVLGLYKLYRQIKKEHSIDNVIDLHDVIRSKILRLFFKFSGIKSFSIKKGRGEKKLLTQKNNKVLKNLKHSTQRYADVFKNAGFDIELKKQKDSLRINLPNNFAFKTSKENKKIGIAPFAMHMQKQYPFEKMLEVIKLLNDKDYEIFIFGGGNSEKQKAKEVEDTFENVSSLIGKFKLEAEIAIISNLDLMISMDSSNMHIASLTGIKIVSIWGATHPFAGFTPFISDDKSFIIQNEDLSCRPCSVYGNKKCFKGNLECFDIEPKKVFDICEIALQS